MDNKGPDGEHAPKEVISVSARKINPSQEKDYDDWLRHYMILERNAPGYLGTTIICPGGTMSSVRYKVSRWAGKSSLDACEYSQQSLELIEEANEFSQEFLCSMISFTTFLLSPFHNNIQN
jgi:hypothetical protein